MNDITYLKESGTLQHKGASLLYYYISVPKTDFSERINAFYEDISRSCIDWINKALYPAVCEEYHSSNDKSKRFTFGYRYFLECRIIFNESNMLSVVINAELKKRGDKLPVAVNRYAQVWNISSGEILPLCAIANKKAVRQYKKIKGTGYYLSQKGLYAITKEARDVGLICH